MSLRIVRAQLLSQGTSFLDLAPTVSGQPHSQQVTITPRVGHAQECGLCTCLCSLGSHYDTSQDMFVLCTGHQTLKKIKNVFSLPREQVLTQQMDGWIDGWLSLTLPDLLCLGNFSGCLLYVKLYSRYMGCTKVE